MHDGILTADKNRELKVKQNRTRLKIKARAEGGGGGETCQWKCTVDINREISMEVWSGG